MASVFFTFDDAVLTGSSVIRWPDFCLCSSFAVISNVGRQSRLGERASNRFKTGLLVVRCSHQTV